MSNCIHCSALRAEVSELRIALGLNGRVAEQRAIGRQFGLGPVEARIAQALYDAAGKVVPRETLDAIGLTEAAYLDGSDALKAHICNLRRKLGGDTIETAHGGYAITDAGRALIFTALKVAA